MKIFIGIYGFASLQTLSKNMDLLRLPELTRTRKFRKYNLNSFILYLNFRNIFHSNAENRLSQMMPLQHQFNGRGITGIS